ncbi:MAG: xanthine dehydrogenase family protein subunit M [Chloroflexota bacterium]
MFARPGLPKFEYVRAQTPKQVSELLSIGDARAMLGGTDLITQMRDDVFRPNVVVDVKHLPGMSEISDTPSGLRIGAAVTMNEIVENPLIAKRYSVLAQAAETVGTYQLRNRATIGGNICNASPVADSTPALNAVQAIIEINGLRGKRELGIDEFITGPGFTALEPDEFVTAILLPPAIEGSVGKYEKLGRTRMGDLAVVSVAVVAHPMSDCMSGYNFTIALGSVTATPIRAYQAENYLRDNPPGEESFRRAADMAEQASSPISDVRAGDLYQRKMINTFTKRALSAAWSALSNRGDA